MSREGIIAFAQTLVGSHYLWGSCGDTPEYDDGAWYNSSSVVPAPASTDLDAPVVFAAQLNRHQTGLYGVYVCAGRFEKVWGGRYARSTDPDLREYLGTLADQPQAVWQPFHLKFSPRLVRGGNIGENDGRIVWGEDCSHKRHFDCVSFVNYVLSKTTAKQWGFSIKEYASAPDGWVTTITMTDAFVAGDILLAGTGHIALLSADGHIVQAEQHDTGVHSDEKFNGTSGAKGWTQRLRVADKWIK